MNKRKSRQSSNLDETIASTISENGQEIVSKRLVTSSQTTVIIPTEANIQIKEHEKMTVKELKNLRNLQKKQKQNLMPILNENIQNLVQGLIEKFDPPYCPNCPNRRADRVCINKDCGEDKFMKLICGKCHFELHQNIINKPEIDIGEFFHKLVKFTIDEKCEKNQNSLQKIDLDNLEALFDNIDCFRQKLDQLREKIEYEIQCFIAPSEINSQLESGIMKALSYCDYDNVQKQLLNIKKCVIFSQNKFYWNNSSEKFKFFQNILIDLETNVNQTGQNMSKSFIGLQQFDLNEIKFKKSTQISIGTSSLSTTKEGEINFFNSDLNNQYYMDYILNRNKKYKMRFRFETQPSQFILVGLMPYREAKNTWIYHIRDYFFYKRFCSSIPAENCTRILKGSDLDQIVQKGWQIEMRIDFENNYIDFYDYPDAKNVNAKYEHIKFQQIDYVITFAFRSNQNVVIEQFEEITSLQQIV